MNLTHSQKNQARCEGCSSAFIPVNTSTTNNKYSTWATTNYQSPLTLPDIWGDAPFVLTGQGSNGSVFITGGVCKAPSNSTLNQAEVSFAVDKALLEGDITYFQIALPATNPSGETPPPDKQGITFRQHLSLALFVAGAPDIVAQGRYGFFQYTGSMDHMANFSASPGTSANALAEFGSTNPVQDQQVGHPDDLNNP